MADTTLSYKSLSIAAISLLLSGCAHNIFEAGDDSERVTVIKGDAESFSQGKDIRLQPFYRNLWAEGERNAVLNFKLLGLASMELGEFDVAKMAFDEAILRIESIYAGDPNAEKAKSMWIEEKIKDFKGEPHERSMLYYYRGLLYLRDGDYQNARASFLAADRHDTFSEQEQYQGDFGLMNYLAAWSSYCDGDLSRARDLHARAVKQDATYFANLDFKYPYLTLVDTGVGPNKETSGQYGEVLLITPRTQAPDIVTGVHTTNRKGSKIALNPPKVVGSVSYQATTRGGRPIQGILDGKAQFKEGAQVLGDVATNIGLMTMMSGAYGGDNSMMNAGGIMSLIGLFSTMASESTRPQADTRNWSSLPDTVYMSFSKTMPEAPATVSFDYTTAGTKNSKQVTFHAVNGRCGIAWGRTRSALSTAHGGIVSIGQPEIVEEDREGKNKIFRSILAQKFGTKPVSTATSQTLSPQQK